MDRGEPGSGGLLSVLRVHGVWRRTRWRFIISKNRSYVYDDCLVCPALLTAPLLARGHGGRDGPGEDIQRSVLRASNVVEVKQSTTPELSSRPCS